MGNMIVRSFKEAEQVEAWVGFDDINAIRAFYKYLGIPVPSRFLDKNAIKSKKDAIFCVNTRVNDSAIVTRVECVGRYKNIITLFDTNHMLASIYD